MIIYRCGGLIKSIDELIEGEQYCVCGIGGIFRKKPIGDTGEYIYKITSTKETVVMLIDEEALQGKIKLGLVRKLALACKPQQKTIKKYYKK